MSMRIIIGEHQSITDIPNAMQSHMKPLHEHATNTLWEGLLILSTLIDHDGKGVGVLRVSSRTVCEPNA